jgi:hypothetical protein
MNVTRKLRKAMTIGRRSPSIAANVVRGGTTLIGGKRLEASPIFVVGCGHSGTSLLVRVLGAHSRIWEVPFESNLGTRSDITSRMLVKYFDLCTLANSKHRWVEKTPNHINCLERLWTIAPNAPVLLIIRDGRDVACSIRKRTGHVRDGILRWVYDNRAGERYWNDSRVHLLRYEQLVVDFERTIKGALAFLGEEYEPSMANYWQSAAPSAGSQQSVSPVGANHDNFRRWQISQPLFDGRGKWHSLAASEKQIVKELAGDMLREYGYVDSNDW